MEFQVNYLAVVVAAIAQMVIGAIWYSPAGFGKKWMALAGIREDEMGSPLKGFAMGLVSALITSMILAALLQISDATDLVSALVFAFWVWLGFVATTTAGAQLWENKPWGLFILNGSYSLIGILVMSAILFSWM